MIYFLVIIQVLLLVSGQTLWKIGLDSVGEFSISNIPKILSSVHIWSGLCIYGIATLLWFYILSKAGGQFSVVYPLGSLAYALGVFVALVVFKENIPVTRWFGVFFILLGCVFISKK